MSHQIETRRTRPGSGLWAVILCAVAGMGGAPFAEAQSVSAPYSPDRIIVRFRADTVTAARSQVLAANGVDRDVELGVVPGLERVKLRPGRTVAETIAALRSNPNVLYAEPDYVVRKNVTPNDTSYGSLWGMANIKAPTAWDTTTGPAGLVVAIIDTGIDRSHPDLADNIWTNPGEALNGLDDDGNGYVDDLNGWDFAYGDNNPSDVDGHGTHTAGTVGARGNNALGVVGVNWQVKLVALKFLDDTGSGYTSNAILAMQYANRMGIKVSNNSWGGGGFSQGMYDAINASKANNHLFIAAAGNSNVNNDTTAHYPSSYNLDNVISVASITSTDGRSSFSNYGRTSVDLGAPGSSILSTTPGNTYSSYSGTSMATPHVAGAAAMIVGLRPTWTYGQVRDAILRTARPITALSGITVTGGTLDLAAAVAYQPSTSPPVAPTGLAATAASATQINLSWTDNSADESGFKVERSTDGVNFTQVGTTAAGVRTYSATGLTASTNYAFRVRAYNANGDSAYSNAATATTQAAPTIPAVPTLSGTASRRLATLSWTNVANETGYRLSRATRSTSGVCGTFSVIKTLGVDVTGTTDTRSNGGAFCYAVQSYNSVGTSARSNVVVLVIPR
jgi:subtilisin family serine protease